ncbi:hypothetical protein FSARC_12493 [Fusarium sarcochroum]|uniref:Uncharacterized protein n=1 Tax=Fusarium sarcochroum TaxID=1208366 RepID=A0A8H4WW54_9HYPO|nr:hypothetical protein FSARC_12493 [Fusarium sarcochroum]
MRPSFVVLRHLLFASFASTSHGYLGVQNDRGSITTSYTVPPQGDEPGIVIVEQPGGSSAPENIVIPATDDRSYVIIIRPHQGPNPISAPITQVVPPRSGQPGQIIIETPETQAGDATVGVLKPVTLQPHDQTGYVTVLRTISGTLASLQLITLSPTGTNRGSVIINVPASALNRANPQAITLEPDEEGGYVTVIEPAGVSFTGKTAVRLTVAPSGGKPGTVIIQTPGPATLGPLGLETQSPNPLASLQRLEGQTITLQPTDANGYVTIIEPAEGSVTPTAPIRTTIPPTGTKPGTVLIQTPPEGNNGRLGGPQATGAGGTAFPPTRTRPEGAVSYTTITRGVPMGFSGSDNDEDDGSDGGSNGGSNGSQDGAGSDGGDGSDNGSGRVQGRPGQGDGDNAGPRQTLTIPPEGGNPGTVLVLTPEGPNKSQPNDNDDSDRSPTGDDEKSNGGNAQGTSGSNNGNKGSSGGSNGQNGDEDDSNNDGSGSGSGSNSGSGSGRPGQGGSSSGGDSDDEDSGTGRGSVQGSGSSGSGSSGSDDNDDETSGNGGSSGSNSGNTSGSGGSSNSDEDDNTDSGGSSGGSKDGNQGGSDSDTGSDGDDATDSGGSSGGSQSGSQGGSGSNSGNNGQGGSNTRSSSSPGKTGGASNDDSGDSGDPTKGDTESEDDGSSGGQDSDGGSSGGKGNTSSSGKGSDNEDDPDFDGHGSKHGGSKDEGGSKGGSGSKSSGSKSSSNGGDASETGSNNDGGDGDGSQSIPLSSGVKGDASTASSVRSRPSKSSGSKNNQNSKSKSNGRASTSQRRTTVRPQVIRTSPATFTVTSSNTVITITVDIVTTLPDDSEASETDGGAESTRTNKGNKASSTTTSSRLRGELEGMGSTRSNSEVEANDRTTVRRPSNSRNVNSDSDATSTADTDDEETSASGADTDTPRTTTIPEDTGGATRSSASDFSTSVDTRLRPGGSGMDSTRRSQTTSAGRSTRSSNDEGTDVDNGPGGETDEPGSPTGAATASDGDDSKSSSSTRSAQGSNGSQSTASRRPGTSNSASSTGSLTGRPAGLGSSAGDGDGEATSRTTQNSGRVTSSASDDEDTGPRSSASRVGGSDVSDEDEATTERSGAGSNSQTTQTGGAGSASTSARTGASASESRDSTSVSANTRVGGSSSTDRTTTGSSRPSGSPARDDVSESGDEGSPSQTARGSNTSSSRASQPTSRGSSTATSEESFNFETIVGTQSVSESEQVPQGDETSQVTDEASATSTRGTATSSQATGAAGESSATDRGTSRSTNAANSGAENTASASGDPPLTGRPAVIRTSSTTGQDGSRTTDIDDEDPEATDSASSAEGLTGGSSGGGATSRTAGQGSPTDDDSEAGETSRSSDGDEVATGTQATGSRVSEGASAGATSAGSGGDDDEDEDGDEEAETTASRTRSAGSQDPDAEETDSATGSDDAEETGEPSGPGDDDEDTSMRTPQVPVPTSPLPGSASDDASRTAELEGLSRDSQVSTFTSPQMPLPTGVSTGPLPDSDLLSSPTEDGSSEATPDLEVPTGAQTAPADDDEDLDPDSGTTVTDEPGSETETPVPSNENPTETEADDADETDSEASGGAMESGTSDDEGETESATATGGSGSGTGSNTDDDSQATTDASGAGPSAGITADNSQTTLISGQTANVTVFRVGQGPARTTVYIPPRSTNEPWTIVIETPISETQSEAATARATDDTLTTAPAIGGNTNVTIFRAGTSPTRRTLYLPPRAADEPGTIVIETPVTQAPSATTTGANDDNEEEEVGVSQTALETSGGRANVTVYSSGTASVRRTIYLPPASSGQAGTLIIETPVSGGDPQATEDAEDDDDEDDEDDGSQTTPLPSGVRPNVTVYSSGTGSTTRTIYLPPTASGEDGTLIIETPVSEPGSDSITRGAGGEGQTTGGSDGRFNTTIFTQGTASTRNTIYFPPTASGEPGTFIVEVPASEVDTETESGDSAEASGPDATITPAPSDDIFPDGNANLTLYRAGESSTRRTIFIPPRTTGDPWTIVIETPVSDTQVEETGTASNFQTTVSSIGGSANFTIFRAGAASTRKTLYVPPKTTGEPGTVIIETPVPRSQTSGLTANPEALTTAGSSGAGTNTTVLVPGSGPGRTTFYFPPSGPNEPGTVYIETPPSEDETGDPGDPAGITGSPTPGTDGIITEIPSGASAYSARTTTTIFSGGSGSITRTIYIPPTATDEPGTLIVETPTFGPDDGSDDSDDVVTEIPSGATAFSARSTTTIFSDGTASTTRTIYIPPTASGEAGTLIIETPTPGSEDNSNEISTEIPSGATVYSAATTVTVTSGGPASVTRTIYIPPTVSGEPGTLIIETPTSTPDDDSDGVITEIPSGATAYSARTTVTVTSGGPASVTRTIYIPPTASDEPGTLIVETPTSEPDDDSDGIITEVPSGASAYSARTTVTITSGGPASVTRTIYIPPTASGEAGTLVIETPTAEPNTDIITEVPSGATAYSARTTVTIVTGGSGSVTRSIYIPPTASDEAGTLVIETPTSQPDNSVITEVPSGASAYSARTTVTVVSGGSGSVTRSIYIPPTASDEAGTMYIETPTERLEATPADNDASGIESGVSAIVAKTTVTVFSGGPGSVTRTVYVPPTASDEAGTVYIETPTVGAQATGDDDEGTILAQTTVTVFSDGPGSVTRTVYVPPTASGQAGTLYIETPTSGSQASATGDENVISARTTVTILTGGPGSVTRTVYVPPTALDEPGTLFIETPTGGSQASLTGDGEVISARTTVTVFSGGPGSVTRSTYIPPTVSDEAGTMYIETPTEGSQASASGDNGVISARTTVTIFSGGPGLVTRTVYVPPTASGEAGTVYIETPTEGSPATPTDDDAGEDGEDDEVISARTTVTVTSGGPGSVTRTVYVPPTASGEAGTLIIEIPTGGPQASATNDIDDAISARTTVTVYSGGPGSVTRTTYVPPTASNEAGTLYIETPTDGSAASPTDGDDDTISARTTVTVFSGGPGSVTRTIYIPPTASGEAGTLIVETPTSGPGNEDASAGITGTGASSPTAVVTSGGQGNVTIYRGGPVTSTRIRFISATVSNEPGTVLIETPTAGPQATGIGNVTIVTGGPASVTQTRYIPATVTEEPGTIVIETPTARVDEDEGRGNVTIYSGVSATGTRTLYIPPTASDERGTIIIETPAGRPVTTVYSGASGSVTRTIFISATASDEPDTVVIETPISGPGSGGPANVTIYSGVSATVATTRFIPGTASDEPGTLIIETPIAESQSGVTYVTIFSGGPGTATTTIFRPPTASGEPGTAIIQTPTERLEEDIATDENGSITGSATRSQAASPSSPGNVTIYSGGPGTVRQTIYIPPTASGERGTVVIETPTSVPDVEASESPIPTARTTVTILSGGPGTATKTIYIPPTASDEAGTVIIETPTSDPDSDASVTEPSAAAGTTIVPTVSGGNVTIYRGGPASVTRTVYLPPAESGERGTVIIETPTGGADGQTTRAPSGGNVTIYTDGPGGGTARETFYFPPTNPDEPGTIIIETPPGSAGTTTAASGGRTNTTIYSGGSVTARRTVYVQATVSGEPDTVFIETPTTGPEAETASGRAYTTIFGGGSGSTTRTITIPAAESGEPDTVLIETPTGEAKESESGDVSATVSAPSGGVFDATITRGGPGSAATTIYVPGESGQPGTVIIQTPTESLDDETSVTGVRGTTTTITRGGPASVRTTVYIPGASGEPDTILVQTPTESADDEEVSATRASGTTVTVTRGGPVTAATTITIPGQSGEPGTVVVETPTESSDEEETSATGTSRTTVTVTRGGPVTAAITITIPGEPGEPGTVVVETPIESNDGEEASATGGNQANVTITRGGPVSAATTIYIPPQSGEPGIVIIETPMGSNTVPDPSVTGGSEANVTITRGGPVTAPTTIYIPPQSGEPGVVIIETPTGAFETPNNAIANVTVYSGGPVTATRTIYVPAKASNEAGTVIIETPDGSTASQTAGSPGNITIYTGIPGIATRTVFVPATASGEPGTILIETPTGGSASATGGVVGNVTIYSGVPGTATRTVFVPATESGEIGTIIIETPTGSGASETGSSAGNVTIYSGGPVTATRTFYIPPTASGEPGTVLIETPVNPSITGTAVANITIVSGGPGSVAQTRYIPPTASGEPGTIVIQTPTGGSGVEETDSAGVTGTATRTLVSPEGRLNVTVYSGVPGTVGQTIYVSATISGEPDTVFIQTPTGGSDADESGMDEPSGTATGTLVTPGGRRNTTIFSGGSGTATRTIYFPPDESGELGTVIVETPTGSPGDGDEEETEGSISGTATATVPASGSGRNVTITNGGPGTATRTIYVPPESSGEPGTIIIEIPTGTAREEDEEEETTSGVSATATGTLVTPESRPNVTITSGGSGSTTRTIYFPPASDEPDEPGTIVIETPTGSGPESQSASETTSGSIDVNIRLPNITIYSSGTASITRTIYYPPRSDATDEPGTIVIETPASESGRPANVTRFVGGPASITTTIYIPPTASGEPGTVFIQTPTSVPDEEEGTSATASATTTNTRFPAGNQNVTSYRGGPGSVTTTIYFPPASDEPEEPGTVIIQTPTSGPDEEIPASNITRFIGGPASITTTIYIPPTATNEPGVVIIQTPTSGPEEETPASVSEVISSTELPSAIQNITRVVAGPASITTTFYIPPTASNEPGVVLIQTPSSTGVSTTTRTPAVVQNVTVFSGGPGSVTTTIYYPPKSDEPESPGTVVIQTPTAVAQSGTSSAPISSATTTQRFPVGSQNVTVYSGGSGSTTRTIYLPPASDDEPGTVIIETPTAAPAASSTGLTGAPAGISTTTTPIVAGTNVTIFRAAPSTATAARTLYEPPAAANEPGTVIVETLVVPSSTTSSTALASSTTTSAAAISSTTTSAAANPAVSSTTTSAAAAVSSTTTSAAAAAISSTTTSAAAAAVSSTTTSAAAAPISSSTTSAAANPVTTTTTTSSAVVVAVSTTRSTLPAVPSYTTLAFGPPFSCDGYGYVLASLLGNTLTQVNLADGSRTTLATNVGPNGGLLGTGLLSGVLGSINGIGFNKFDGYIYGFVIQKPITNLLSCLGGCPQSQLIRIARNGGYQLLAVTLETNAISMGDIDDQGRLWVSESGKKWWSIDVKPKSATYLKVTTGTSAADLLSGVGDWSYVPGGGNYLYSVQASVIESGLLRTNIVRWSLDTQKWERYQSYPGLLLTALNLIWGATMASPDGTLYAQENLLGQTWKFTLGTSADPVSIPGGAILNLSGDGARCIGAYAG